MSANASLAGVLRWRRCLPSLKLLLLLLMTLMAMMIKRDVAAGHESTSASIGV